MFQYAFISYICKYTKGGALNKGLCTFAAWKKKKRQKRRQNSSSKACLNECISLISYCFSIAQGDKAIINLDLLLGI